MSDLLTPEQAAARLGICTRTLRAHVRAGELAYIATGRGQTRQHRMFHPADIEAFIESRRRFEYLPAARQPARRPKSLPSFDIIDFKALSDARRDAKRKPPKSGGSGKASKPSKPRRGAAATR